MAQARRNCWLVCETALCVERVLQSLSLHPSCPIELARIDAHIVGAIELYLIVASRSGEAARRTRFQTATGDHHVA
jgi:hypothetical protein